jgi:aminoacrylate peracid reductase
MAPYVPGSKVGNTVYVAGTLALDADGKVAHVGDIKRQTRFTLESVKTVVEATGGTMADIVFNGIFIKDLADYKAMNEVYKEFFPAPPPRYCIRADLVLEEFLVEIYSIAHIE